MAGSLGISKIQRPGSGGDLPHGGEYIPYPIARRVNSSHTVVMDDDLENASLGSYQDRQRTFPDMRSKVNTPLVSTLTLPIICVLILMYVDIIGHDLYHVLLPHSFLKDLTSNIV